MGQKIHPGGFRVGYIQDWKSTWFDEKDFADILLEDLKIRDHIEGKLAHAGLSNITISASRAAKSMRCAKTCTSSPANRSRSTSAR